MSKKTSAFNEANLAIMGIYDVVYEVYTNLKTVYGSTIDQLDKSKTIFPDKIDDMCRGHVRKILESFVSNNTGFFTKDYERIHTNAFGLKGFSLLDSKHEKPLQITITYISFRTFLEELLIVIVRILAQRQNRQDPFKALERVYMEVNNHIQALIVQYRERISVNTEPEGYKENPYLYVYSQFSLISCNQNNHTIVPDMYCAEKLDGSGFYRLPIHRCKTCGRKFVGKYTLNYYQKQYGNIYIIAQNEPVTVASGSYKGFDSETELHSRGYNVAERGMSEKERRNFLIRLIESGEMTYFEICRDLKSAIHAQQNLPSHAPCISKWKSDLIFLSEYVENNSKIE